MRTLILLLLWLLTASSKAGEIDLLTKEFKGIKSLEVFFSQETKLPIAGDEVSLYKGVIYYKRPLKFRWEYTWGSSALIVSNGELLKSSIGGNCQIIKVSRDNLFPLIELVEEPELFKERFKLTSFKRNGEYAVLRLKPAYKDAFFKEITFVLRKGSLFEVEVVQEDGTKELYKVEKIVKNPPLRDSLFRIIPCK
ncbi:LolA family protein [Thermovibrio sp.]